MKTLIIYDSVFGNTEKVAKAISKAFAKEVEIAKVSEVKIEQLCGLNLLIVGSPTRAFRPTKELTAFLREIPENSLKKVRIAAFDTRVDVKELNNKLRNRPLVFTDDALSNDINNNDIIWNEFDRLKVNFEKGKSNQVYNTLMKNTTTIEIPKTDTVTIQIKNPEKQTDEANVVIINSYKENQENKRDVQNFVSHFKARYESIKRWLARIVKNTISQNDN